ncbi:MAG: hypothetical protein GXP32_05650 [Kiritimatiellaeota bacterium]|nr:hypothetical protein [Kiritimatiellota bacterium]
MKSETGLSQSKALARVFIIQGGKTGNFGEGGWGKDKIMIGKSREIAYIAF